MGRIRIERAAPEGPVRRVVVDGIVYDVTKGHPLAEGMIEVLSTKPHQGTSPSALRLAEIRSNHLFEKQLAKAEHSEDYETQASVDRADLLGAFDKVMQVVNDWCVEYNNEGGIDAGDLAWRLEEAGYALPPDDDE
jgi:hypothetical protein